MNLILCNFPQFTLYRLEPYPETFSQANRTLISRLEDAINKGARPWTGLLVLITLYESRFILTRRRKSSVKHLSSLRLLVLVQHANELNPVNMKSVHKLSIVLVLVITPHCLGKSK